IRSIVESSTPLFSPVWTGGSDELAYGAGNAPGQAVAAKRRRATGEDVGSLAPPPFQGFDVPLAWDVSGQNLAVRATEAASPDKVSQSHLEIVSTNGARH